MADDAVNLNEVKSLPLEQNGRFTNPWETWIAPTLATGFKMKWIAGFWNAPRTIPHEHESLSVEKPDFGLIDLETKKDSKIGYTWLGHATSVFQLGDANVSVVTDPVFQDYCSPIGWFISKISKRIRRFTPIPCGIKDLPENLGIVLISHNHYDHLSDVCVRGIYSEFPHVRWYVGLGLKSWFEECGIPGEQVTEMRWWDKVEFQGKSIVPVQIHCLPAQHWSRRGLFDQNKTLWASWAVTSTKSRVYFAGDTGYCSAFKEIGRYVGPFSLSSIPIGAFHPRVCLSPQHVDPEQALQIHRDIKSKQSVAIHWGTFALGEEHFSEPVKELDHHKTSTNDKFDATVHGRTIIYDC